MSSIPQDLNPGSWDTSLDFYCLARDKESSFCILGEILQVFNSHTALQMEFTSTHLQWLQQAFLVLKILFVTQASLEGTHSIHLQEALPSICLQDCRINKTPRRERSGGNKASYIISQGRDSFWQKIASSHLVSCSPMLTHALFEHRDWVYISDLSW